MIKMRVAGRVGLEARLHVVLTAIDFDDKSLRKARKIDDELVDWHLAAKVEALSLQQPNLMPEFSLGISLIIAKLAGNLVCHL